jgi:hypothetical protein
MAITVGDDVKALLGISTTIPSGLLTIADRWVTSRMEARGLSIPTTATDSMKLAGSFICAAFVIDSKESNKSWNQAVSLAGGSFTKSDAAKVWEQRAKDEIEAMTSSGEPIFEAVTYWEDEDCLEG